MRISVVILPDEPWSAGGWRWQRAEELGVHAAYTYDHIAWRSLRDSTWYSAVPVLTAAALSTERVRLGTMVASPNFRHPVPFARELLALDDVSAGRLTLGIGAGGLGWDATALGQDEWSPRERADRFAEFVELLDLLLRQPVTTHNGRYYSAVDAPMRPGCVQQPRVPFTVAAAGPRAMRVAARFGDAWVTTGDRTVEGPVGPVDGAAMIAGQVSMLEEACRAVDRDPASLAHVVVTGPILDPTLSSPEAFVDAVGHYESAGVDELVVHWPRADGPFAGDQGAFEAAVSAALA